MKSRQVCLKKPEQRKRMWEAKLLKGIRVLELMMLFCSAVGNEHPYIALG